jgi:MFS family permease
MNPSRITPLVLAVALFMENMDSTVIATSLAAIAADIGTEPIALKLALTAYLVALAIFIPISSWMADRFGARNVFRGAMAVFVIGSIACAFSGSLMAFVAAMAWLTIPGLIGPIVGPPFGGFLTTYFSWHWIFLINVPIGILGIWLVGSFLPDMKRSAPRQIDLKGFVLAGLAFSGVVFGISVVTLPALPVFIGVVTIAVGLAAGVGYFFHARRTEYPLLELRLLRFPLFRMSVVAGTFFRLGQGAVPFLFPLMLQLVFGMTPFESGMVTFAGAIGALAAKFAATKLFITFGFRTALTAATLFSTLGIVAMGFYFPSTPVPLMVTVLIVAGFAQSIFWTGSNAFTFADIEDKDTGQANVISQVLSQITIAMGVALGGGILEASHMLRGGELVLADFHVAFYLVAAVCGVSTLLFMRMPANAGSQLSGHKIEKAAEKSELV